MLKSVSLNFSETGPITLDAKGVTIFVGPNNSGKSLVLREIESVIRGYISETPWKIVTDFEIEWPDSDKVDQCIDKVKINQPSSFIGPPPSINQRDPWGNQEKNDGIYLGSMNSRGEADIRRVGFSSLTAALTEKTNKDWVALHFLWAGVIRLDGQSRFNLANDVPAGDLISNPTNVLASLFKDDAARANVSRLTKDAFNLNFYIDPTNSGHLRIKFDERSPPPDEQSLNAVTREFFSNSISIKEVGDGVQAYTSIVAAVLSQQYHTILIDEPEAFLHPPLARKLGKSLAEIAAASSGVLMASTHSSDFLMGCVQASSSVTVVRLDYSQGKSSAKSIDPVRLKSFLKQPLMRSASVISGLFHDGVIVVESDSDRVFYSEIFYRLAEGKSNYPSILFVNAQNKQTIQRIIGPLREFGVPAAAIVDIDIVKDGGPQLTDLMKAAKIPSESYQRLGQQRSAINNAFVTSGRKMKTEGGVSLLSSDDRKAADEFFDYFESFGVFSVRLGELENWLSDLAVPKNKTAWPIRMLDRLGQDPTDPNYVRPSASDVWKFLEKIVDWIKNSAREGT
jgi:hypothetical protein